MPNVQAIVISLTDEYRAPGLRAQLEGLCIPYLTLRAVDGRMSPDPYAEFGVDRDAVIEFVGRPLSGTEIACALSHMRAYETGHQNQLDWMLVLEDDAGISQDIQLSLEILEVLGQEHPSVINLLPHDGVWRRKSVMSLDYGGSTYWLGRYYQPPFGAVAYWINSAAMVSALRFRSVTSYSDWPPWSYLVDFWSIYPWLATHEGATSSEIDSDRSPIQALSPLGNRNPASWLNALPEFRPRRLRTGAHLLGSHRTYLKRAAAPRLASLLRKPRTRRLNGDSAAPWLR